MLLSVLYTLAGRLGALFSPMPRLVGPGRSWESSVLGRGCGMLRIKVGPPRLELCSTMGRASWRQLYRKVLLVSMPAGLGRQEFGVRAGPCSREQESPDAMFSPA